MSRRQIIDQLAGRLQQIAPGKIWTLPDGDYTCTTTVQAAAPWRKTPYPASQLPGICWRDKAEKIQEQTFGLAARWRLTLHLAGYLTGTAPAGAARVLMADLLATIGSDPRHGGLAHYTELAAHRLLLREGGNPAAACLVELAIIYTPGRETGETNRLQDELDNYLTDESGNYLNW